MPTLKLGLADAWKILYHTNSALRDESDPHWCVSVSEQLNRPKCVREKKYEPWEEKEVCLAFPSVNDLNHLMKYNEGKMFSVSQSLQQI